ncbi:unnamed protein product [Vitrella brassicaformis CCMP3155]|uniref:SKP1 component POZ domain-containing protein n=1 Tax=Vitrella brassicaformis (strain CCMP3155) TaxID=1169540 RepID=A0A0G4GS92_VITBC|nr:unnamed protein product [Vitrella brassicaformis CCMP3155]|eukprot:CEM33469.1 unnamed protein product [Vitrella brassicaformis CCMP3155]
MCCVWPSCPEEARRLWEQASSAEDVWCSDVWYLHKTQTCSDNSLIRSGSSDPIPLPEVDSAQLKQISEYAEHHKGQAADISKPIQTDELTEVVADDWDAKFIERLTVDGLCSLTLAAEFVDCRPLIQLACARIACIIAYVGFDDIAALAALEAGTSTGKYTHIPRDAIPFDWHRMATHKEKKLLSI